jgi:hypothetical protein
MGGAAGQRAELPQAVVIRGAAEAVMALRLAGDRPVLLLSAPGAAAMLGAAGWRALVSHAAAAVPEARLTDALCCGVAPGHALAALREGCRILVLDGACPAFDAVESAAAEVGATLLPSRPPALDLRGLDLRRPVVHARIAQWLAADPDDSAAIWR